MNIDVNQTKLVLDFHDDIKIEELLYLTNLKELTLFNFKLDNYILSIISKLNLVKLVFVNCKIEDLSLITNLNLRDLQIINCKFDDFEYINDFINLENLTLQKFDFIDLSLLPIIKTIKKLDLYYSNIGNKEEIVSAQNLEELRIDRTNFDDLSLLANLNLKRLIIGRKQTKNINLLDKKLDIVDEMNQRIVDYGK